MKRSIHIPCCIAAMSVIALSTISCHRDPIHVREDKLEVRFNFDLAENDPAMHVKPHMPSLMTVAFYDVETGRCARTCHFTYNGGRVQGLEPGRYNLLAYSSDTEYTKVIGENDFNAVLAETYEVSAFADSVGVTIREPDHLMVGRMLDVEIPYLSKEDSTYVLRPDVSTIMDSYYLQVDSLKGLENINSVEVYLTGHSRDNMIGHGVRSSKNVTLRIPCYVNIDDYCLWSKFCTFGKIPDLAGNAVLHIVVTGAGGRTYDFEDDITEQYNDPSHILRLCFHGEIKPREQSGFDPEVGEWDDDVTDVEIN